MAADKDNKPSTEAADGGTQYSALTKRPAPKVVEADDGVSSYVAGVRIVDELKQRKQKFNGWEHDENALLVVRSLEQGEYNKFAGMDFSGVDFSGANLSSINLANADLRNANLAGVDLRGADLRGADLRGVNLEEADLEGANLEGALLDGAYLKNTHIVGVKLSKVALNELEKMQQLQRQAEEGLLDLRKVNLKYLDLRRLDLRGVDLTGVNLAGVNLVGVNLTGVKIDPMYLDGTYAFKEGFGRKVEIKKGNTAGLDLTSANQIKANLTELEVLRRKRLARQDEEQQRIEEISRAAEEMRRREEEALAAAAVQAPAAVQTDAVQMSAAAQNAGAVPAPVSAEQEEASQSGLSAELELLRARRQQQVSAEELKARLKDVVLEKRPALKSGAQSLVTKRPRRKEELPPSKYDFPILYPIDEDEKKKIQPQQKSSVQEMTKAAGDAVKNVWKKIMPRRGARVSKQRQRS